MVALDIGQNEEKVNSGGVRGWLLKGHERKEKDV